MLIDQLTEDTNSQIYTFKSNLQSIDFLEVFLCELKEQLTLSEHVYSAIRITLNEAISNAIIHGNKCDPDKKVLLSVELRRENLICFSIKDEGNGFDFENIPDPTSAEQANKPCGRGVFLIKKLADLAVFSDNGATLILCFDIAKTRSYGYQRPLNYLH